MDCSESSSGQTYFVFVPVYALDLDKVTRTNREKRKVEGGEKELGKWQENEMCMHALRAQYFAEGNKKPCECSSEIAAEIGSPVLRYLRLVLNFDHTCPFLFVAFGQRIF